MKGFQFLFLLCMLFISQTTLAQTGLFFNVTSSGGLPGNVSVTLCLNGLGPISCQNYNISNLNLTATTTIPNHVYPAAGIKVNTPGYSVTSGCTPASDGYCIFAVSNTASATIGITQNGNTNLPWYPSLQAFEHYNSGRSHVFSQAVFGGTMSNNNTVDTLSSVSSYPAGYPSGYNMSYLDANDAYIYGGGYGNIAGSIGAFVAKVDPSTLAAIWYNQLIITGTDWDYPGSMGILDDGYIYVSYGYRLSKIDPASGNTIATLVLPTGGGLPENTSFNGFNATADGTIIMKSVYRQAGCIFQGPDALLDCPDPTDVPPSILVSVNPTTMTVIDNVTLPAPVGARPTIAQYNNINYVYLLEATTAIRYSIQNGIFTLDNSWNPGTITISGQTLATSFVVVNDWVVAQTNTLPSAIPLSLIAINQGNAATQFSVQPFAGDAIPTDILLAFSTASPTGTQAFSWAPMSVSGDSATNLVYTDDALPGEIAAYQISDNGFSLVWKENQRTTEFTTLINSQGNRVLVGTHIPDTQIPGNNSNDFVVWRNALTGEQLAISPELPAMTQGTMIQPYYSGDMFFEGELGTLFKLSPSPTLRFNKLIKNRRRPGS